MLFCPECGTQIEKGICLCPKCGEEMLYNRRKGLSFFWFNIKSEFNKERFFSAISYVGFLWVVPLLRNKNSTLTMFHINQGICLFLAEIIYGIFYLILKKLLLEISIWLYSIIAVAGVAEILFIIFAGIGIFSAIKGKKRELPIIGGLKILKQGYYSKHSF